MSQGVLWLPVAHPSRACLKHPASSAHKVEQQQRTMKIVWPLQPAYSGNQGIWRLWHWHIPHYCDVTKAGQDTCNHASWNGWNGDIHYYTSVNSKFGPGVSALFGIEFLAWFTAVVSMGVRTERDMFCTLSSHWRTKPFWMCGFTVLVENMPFNPSTHDCSEHFEGATKCCLLHVSDECPSLCLFVLATSVTRKQKDANGAYISGTIASWQLYECYGWSSLQRRFNTDQQQFGWGRTNCSKRTHYCIMGR